MIRSVAEVHVGQIDHGDFLFWTYLICRVESSRRSTGYNLIRIDGTQERMEVLGRELTLAHCRSIIREREREAAVQAVLGAGP